MPDGSTRELRKGDVPVTGAVPVISGIYVAVDDPRMKYDADNRILYMPDGSRYTFNCCPDGVEYVQYIDRNGNVMNYNSRDGWTDTVGRRIGVGLNNHLESGQESKQQQVTLPGPQGTTRTYTLVWKNLDKVLSSGLGAADLRYVADFSSPGGQIFSPSLFQSSPPDQIQGGGRIFNPEVLSDVILPNGQRYSFTYNLYGEIVKVQLPTGGYHKYEYGIIPALDNRISVLVYGQANRGVVQHSVSESGNASDERTWNYSVDPAGQYVVTETRPDNTRIERYVHRENDAGHQNFGLNDVLTGRVYDERVYAADNRMIRRTMTEWQRNVINYPPVIETTKFATRNPRPVRIVEILVDAAGSAVAKTTTMNYDAELNVTARNYHDYVQIALSFAQTAAIGSIPNGSLLRTDESTYLVNDPDIDQGVRGGYRSRNLLSLPTKNIIKDGSGTVVFAAQNKYDESEYPLTTYPVVVNWADPQTSFRGNITTVRNWVNYNSGSFSAWGSWNAGNWVITHSWYDQSGNVVRTKDGRGNESTFSYSDNFDGVGAQNSYAYLTSSSNALGHTVTSKFDYQTGLIIDLVNPNGVVTRNEYNDPFNRPTKSISAYGTSLQSQQTTQYDDANKRSVTTADLNVYGDNKLKGEVVYDGLGRAVESREYENATSYIRSFTEYDVLGRPHRASNPHRPGDPIAWTETAYDSLGRTVDVETPDGAHVITQYSGGNQMTVIDQAGKKRRTETDALERLIKVIEDVGNLNYVTSYSYDALGNLRLVTQGERNRTFLYDSLSRLVSATNPESGTVTYDYDPKGNLTDTTDARGARMTMTFDELNRVRSKVYSGTTAEGVAAANATPQVKYFYDGYSGMPPGAPSWPGTPSKGRLTGVTYGTGADGTYYKYDAAGRIVTNHQRQGIKDYATNYTYNLADEVTFEQRGNFVNNVWKDYFRNSWTYDSAGRISAMDASFTPFNSSVFLVKDISYAASGALKSEKYGNGLIHSMGYNNRQQPIEIRLGRQDNLESVFTLYYIYGTASNANVQDPEITLTQNNGSIARVKYSVSGAIKYAQTFQYDPIDRLRYAVEHNNGVYNDGTRSWYQTFAYDPYGNRAVDVGNTSDNADATNTALQSSDFSEANNRITLSGYRYDSVGNLITERGNTYEYDAESRIVKATMGGVVTSEYGYDGIGRRVRKVVGGAATRFEYGAGGELIAERNEATGFVTKGYCYKGGELIATTTNGTTYEYATADHLGSPRAWTGGAGNVVAGGLHDYMPFGEELLAGYGTRTTDQGYAANPQQDGQRKQFGSKDRDVETGLSYFLARYYSSIQGRFTSVDPGNAGADLGDPQSLNGYAFARNNPLIYSDPSGMRYRICTPDGKECYEHSDDDFNAGRRAGKKDGYTFTGDGKYFEKGEIRDKDGNVIAKYEQISLDEPAHRLAFEMQKQFYSVDLYKRVAANLVSSAIFGGYKFNRQNWSRNRINKSIEKLRKGQDLEVDSVEEARELLDHMPDLRPATYEKKMPNPSGRMRDGFDDPRGTYRGDLINKQNPGGDIHPGIDNKAHRENPHYNIKFSDGTKATIIIKTKK
jgi:RHS repeat-associated protein